MVDVRGVRDDEGELLMSTANAQCKMQNRNVKMQYACELKRKGHLIFVGD